MSWTKLQKNLYASRTRLALEGLARSIVTGAVFKVRGLTRPIFPLVWLLELEAPGYTWMADHRRLSGLVWSAPLSRVNSKTPKSRHVGSHATSGGERGEEEEEEGGGGDRREFESARWGWWKSWRYSWSKSPSSPPPASSPESVILSFIYLFIPPPPSPHHAKTLTSFDSFEYIRHNLWRGHARINEMDTIPFSDFVEFVRDGELLYTNSELIRSLQP